MERRWRELATSRLRMYLIQACASTEANRGQFKIVQRFPFALPWGIKPQLVYERHWGRGGSTTAEHICRSLSLAFEIWGGSGVNACCRGISFLIPEVLRGPYFPNIYITSAVYIVSAARYRKPPSCLNHNNGSHRSPPSSRLPRVQRPKSCRRTRMTL